MVQGELEAAIVMNIPTLAPLLASLVTQDIYISGSFLLVYGDDCDRQFVADVLMAVLDPRIRYN